MNRAYGDLPWDARDTIVVGQFIHGLDDTDLKKTCVFPSSKYSKSSHLFC